MSTYSISVDSKMEFPVSIGEWKVFVLYNRIYCVTSNQNDDAYLHIFGDFPLMEGCLLFTDEPTPSVSFHFNDEESFKKIYHITHIVKESTELPLDVAKTEILTCNEQDPIIEDEVTLAPDQDWVIITANEKQSPKRTSYLRFRVLIVKESWQQCQLPSKLMENPFVECAYRG